MRLPLASCAAALLASVSGCASFRPPAPGAAERARALASYVARLRVTLDGPELRARTVVLVGFRRPDALRIEVPGPTGARMVAVAAQGRLRVVFPAERACYEGGATAAELQALFGVGLAPAEVMDLLLGTAPARSRRSRVDWQGALPGRVQTDLEDGTHLDVRVEQAAAEPVLPAGAFEPPRCEGCRAVDAAEARRLWSRR